MYSRRSSRLTRNQEKQNKKQFYISILGIIIILFVFFKFGLAALGEAGSFISSIGGNEEGTPQNEDVPLLPPQLDSIPSATDNSAMTISGSASQSEGVIEIFLNEILEDRITLENTNAFESTPIRLKEGENVFTARLTHKKKESSLSDPASISYYKDKPSLEITHPQEGQTFRREDKTIEIDGKTEHDNTVRVNDFIAAVDGQGNFSYSLSLNDGDNEIKIVAENPAGITEEKTLKVRYEP